MARICPVHVILHGFLVSTSTFKDLKDNSVNVFFTRNHFISNLVLDSLKFKKLIELASLLYAITTRGVYNVKLYQTIWM